MTEKLVVVGNLTNIILKTLFVRLQEVVLWESSDVSALCRCLYISTMIVICHLDRLSFPPAIFRDAGPKCPVDNEPLYESQVIIDNVSKHF